MTSNANLNPELKLTVVPLTAIGTTEVEKKSNLRQTIEEKISKDLAETTAQIKDFKKEIDDIKEKVKKISSASPLHTSGRFLRTIGLVALYALGILTLIPAAIVMVNALNKKNLSDAKVFDVAHRYMTLKSQEQIALEDQWERLKEEAAENLQNPVDIKFKISGLEAKPFHMTVEKTAGYLYEENEKGVLSDMGQKRAFIQNQIDEIQDILKKQLFPKA